MRTADFARRHAARAALILVLAGAGVLVAQAPAEDDYAALSTGTLTAGEGKPGDDKAAWGQFRGPNRDAIATDARSLYRAWPGGGEPKVLWKVEGLGPGFSGPAVVAGRVFLEDYDKPNSLWMMRCLSLADGKEIWRWSYKRLIRPNHQITRTVPSADEKFVLIVDPKCVLHCFDATSGKRVWAKDLVREFGVVIPAWYNGQCLLNEPDRVVFGVGGKGALMAAFEKATGKVLWRTPNPDKIDLSHSSVMPMTLAGVKQYVWCTMKGVVGIDTEGKLLWLGPTDEAGKLAWKPETAVAPSAVQLSGDRVFMTSSYNVGSVMFKVSVADGKWTARSLFTLKPDQFASDCQTPIVLNDRIFAVQGERFACANADGKVLWASPADTKFGLGPFLAADGLIYVAQGDGGKLHVIDAAAGAWKEVAAASVLTGHDVWAPMALVNGKLLLRDMGKLVCIEVGPAAK